VPSRAVAVVAFALLIAAFVVDSLTPHDVVIAIVFDIPIVLAALTRSRRLTAALVVAALAANLTAALIDSARDGYRFEPVWIADRFLVTISIVVVGYLSTVVQERSESVGRLAAQEARARREATLAAASDRIRASLSPNVVTRAIVREAARTLDGSAAFWYPASRGAEILAAHAGTSEVQVVDERPSPEILSLVYRVGDERVVSVVSADDPIGRFVLDGLGAHSALAIPVADRGTNFGVLIVARSNAHRLEDGAVAEARGFAVVAVDALAQARLFAELAERNEALSERQDVIRDLVYALSHDLRTPLAALATTLRQAADGAYGPLPDRYAGVLRDSLVSIDDLRRLAETLLLVARFESGERQPEREPVDLAKVSAEVTSELHAMAEARGITLMTTSAGGAIVRGGRGDLKRALANLVANALAHTPTGGTVTLQIAQSSETVEAVVSDDGFGIREEARPALFQRFSSASRSGGGTGLGLYIVRRIAEETGGSVRYQPRQPRGSVFTLSLPKDRG
jgi:signal transduction histidine kinase